MSDRIEPLIDSSDDSIVADLLRSSLAANPGCCGDNNWRGHLCEYHRGFIEGVDAALDWLKNGPDDA